MRLAVLIFGAAFVAAPAHAFTSKFDGDWSVALRTTVGECPQSTDGTVRIAEGRVVASSGEGVGVWGYVEDSGAVSARFTQGEAMLRANGTIKGAKASGAWSSNTNYCGGTWTAQRAK